MSLIWFIAFLAAISVSVLFAAGGGDEGEPGKPDSVGPAHGADNADSAVHTEADMVAMIKKYCEDKGWRFSTSEIVFQKKTDIGWEFSIGGEEKAHGIWIDPKTLEVVKFAHGI